MTGHPETRLEQALADLRASMDAEPLSERVLDLTAQLAAALEAQQADTAGIPSPPALPDGFGADAPVQK